MMANNPKTDNNQLGHKSRKYQDWESNNPKTDNNQQSENP